jgi:hypothetical protein
MAVGAVLGWSSADFGSGEFGFDIFPMVFGFGDPETYQIRFRVSVSTCGYPMEVRNRSF